MTTTPSRRIALDTETTGFGHSAALLSFFAVEFDLHTGKPGRELGFDFNPGVSIPWRITEITGITNAMVAGCPRLSRNHCLDIAAFLSGAEVWIHNRSFDEGVLDRSLALFKVPALRTVAQLQCSMQMAKKMGHAKVSLDALCQHYGIDLSGRNHHGARVDTHLLRQLVVRLHAKSRPAQAPTPAATPLQPQIQASSASQVSLRPSSQPRRQYNPSPTKLFTS